MPIQIKDKSYTMVHERLQLVHESGKTFEILASEPLACGERWVWRVTIKIDERQYIGSAEVHLNSKNPAEMQDPWATAETSGIGRAVGMAGFGSVESIASADELVRSEPTPAPSRHNGRQDAQASAPQDDLSTRIKALSGRARSLGIDSNEKWQSMLRYLEIGKIKSDVEITLIESYLDGEEAKRAETAF